MESAFFDEWLEVIERWFSREKRIRESARERNGVQAVSFISKLEDLDSMLKIGGFQQMFEEEKIDKLKNVSRELIDFFYTKHKLIAEMNSGRRGPPRADRDLAIYILFFIVHSMQIKDKERKKNNLELLKKYFKGDIERCDYDVLDFIKGELHLPTLRNDSGWYSRLKSDLYNRILTRPLEKATNSLSDDQKIIKTEFESYLLEFDLKDDFLFKCHKFLWLRFEKDGQNQ